MTSESPPITKKTRRNKYFRLVLFGTCEPTNGPASNLIYDPSPKQSAALKSPDQENDTVLIFLLLQNFIW